MKAKGAFSLFADLFSLIVKHPLVLLPLLVYAIFQFPLSGKMEDIGQSNPLLLITASVLMGATSYFCSLYTVALADQAQNGEQLNLSASLYKVLRALPAVLKITFLMILVGVVSVALGVGLAFLGAALFSGIMAGNLLVFYLFMVLAGAVAILPMIFFWLNYVLLANIIAVIEGVKAKEAMARNKLLVLKNRRFLGSVFGVYILFCIIMAAIVGAFVFAFPGIMAPAMSFVGAFFPTLITILVMFLAYKECARRVAL